MDANNIHCDYYWIFDFMDKIIFIALLHKNKQRWFKFHVVQTSPAEGRNSQSGVREGAA